MIYIVKMTDIHYPEVEAWTYDEFMFREYIDEMHMVYTFIQLEYFVESVSSGNELEEVLIRYNLDISQELCYCYSLDKTVRVCFNKKFIIDWRDGEYNTQLASVCKNIANSLLKNSIGSLIKIIRIMTVLTPDMKDTVMDFAYTMINYGIYAGKYSTRYEKKKQIREKYKKESESVPSADMIDDIKLLALVNRLI